MNKIALLCCTLTISSCASLMKSEQELVQNGGQSPVYCSKLESSNLKIATEKYLEKCFLKSRKIVMNGSQITADYHVYRKEELESTKYFLVVGYTYYNRAVFINKSSSQACISEMQVYAPKKNASPGSSWFEPFREIAEGKEPGCLF
jgi:hypothetical protein